MNLEQEQQKFNPAIEHLESELLKLRTGRANSSMIDEVKVDYYGTPTPIKGLATISVPEVRVILVQPWDKNALAPIEKAIRDAGLGLGPVNEGDKIRITLPALTEERRKELAKFAGKIAEEARVRLRSAREEIWKAVQQEEKDGKITEDEKFRLKEKLQEATDKYNEKIKAIHEAKEKEIMTI